MFKRCQSFRLVAAGVQAGQENRNLHNPHEAFEVGTEKGVLITTFHY
jgi:hypothetical protein